jgi:hypothetical protein
MTNYKYKIVKYLNINNYLFSTIDHIKYFKKRKYTYFMSGFKSVVVGYIILTIDGFCEYPILGLLDINLKNDLCANIKKNYQYKIQKIIYKFKNISYDLSKIIINYIF